MVLRPSEQSPSERVLFDRATVVYASSSPGRRFTCFKCRAIHPAAVGAVFQVGWRWDSGICQRYRNDSGT
jgi:hypothetical protein